MTALTERATVFRAAILAFIEERRDAKLKGDDTDKDTAGKYDYAVWLADAASRAHHLRVVTHPIKFTHSSIKGATSIFSKDLFIKDVSEVGTHSLQGKVQEDFAITDAKHLDVYSLLTNVVVENKRLIEWVSSGDNDLLLALHEDKKVAESILSDFNKVNQVDGKVISHTLAKQVYWLNGEEPIDDLQYHLLQPMFSSSLEDVVHKNIKESRNAMFNARGTSKQLPTYEPHYTYSGLVGRVLGGSNAQNVSPRNKTRGGINYLLASLPPKWSSGNRIKVLRVDSVLNAFGRFDDVPFLLKELSTFLLSDPESIKATREKREQLEQALGQQLALFGTSICQSQEPGWTRSADCELPECEKLWLDPERTELPLRESHKDEDAAFNAAYTWGDWPDQVASRFANWLNSYLRKKGLVAVGDAEFKHWAKQAVVGDPDWPIPQQRRATGGTV